MPVVDSSAPVYNTLAAGPHNSRELQDECQKVRGTYHDLDGKKGMVELVAEDKKENSFLKQLIPYLARSLLLIYMLYIYISYLYAPPYCLTPMIVSE